jgi:hypothetical protein
MNTWVSAGVYLGAAHVFLSESGDGVLVLRLNVAEGSIDLFTSVDRGETFAQTTVTGLTLQETVPFADWHIFVDSTLTLILIPNGENCLLSMNGGATFGPVLEFLEEGPPWRVYAAGSTAGLRLVVCALFPEGSGSDGIYVTQDFFGTSAFYDDTLMGLSSLGPLSPSVFITDDNKVTIVGSDYDEDISEYVPIVAKFDGVTWSTFAAPTDAGSLYRLEGDPTGTILYASATNGNPLKSADLGETWTSLDVQGPIAQGMNGQVVLGYQTVGESVYVALSTDTATTFSNEITITETAIQNNAVSGDGSLAAVIDADTGELWLTEIVHIEVGPLLDERRYLYHVVFSIDGNNLDLVQSITVDELEDLEIYVIRQEATTILCSLPSAMTPGNWTLTLSNGNGNNYSTTLPIIDDLRAVHYP